MPETMDHVEEWRIARRRYARPPKALLHDRQERAMLDVAQTYERTAAGITSVAISGGMPQMPSGGGSMAPPISALPSLIVSIKAFRSRLSAIARRISGLSKGGLSRLTIRLRLTLVGVSSQIAFGPFLGGQNQRDKDRAKCGADGGLRRPRCVFRHRRLQSGWGCNLTLLSAASYTEFAEAQPRQNG